MRYFILLALVLTLVSCKQDFVFKYEVQTEQTESKNLIFSQSYPLFGDDFVDSIIKRELYRFKTDFQKQIGPDLISENWKNEQSVDVECVYVDEGYLSLLIRNYTFSGGAHGNTELRAIILDVHSRQVLDLKDFFKGEFFTSLQTHIRIKLREQLGFDAFIDEGTMELSDFSVFNLTDDDLVFYFPAYQVAAYSFGTQTVSLPYILFENFQFPR